MQDTNRSNPTRRRLARFALPATGLMLLGAGMAAQAHDFDHGDGHRGFADHSPHHVGHHRFDHRHGFAARSPHHEWHHHWRHHRDHDWRWHHDHDFARYHHRGWDHDGWRGGYVQVWLGR